MQCAFLRTGACQKILPNRDSPLPKKHGFRRLQSEYPTDYFIGIRLRMALIYDVMPAIYNHVIIARKAKSGLFGGCYVAKHLERIDHNAICY
jgi:hypothetical protein